MSHTDDNRQRIFADIDAERLRQDAKWGAQNHADVDPAAVGRALSAFIEIQPLAALPSRPSHRRAQARARAGR
jgi:hypothetical protein